VIIIPSPPNANTTPDPRANRSTGYPLAIKTMLASRAGAQPAPISSWPAMRMGQRVPGLVDGVAAAHYREHAAQIRKWRTAERKQV
jgi:hypothetical protein